MVFSSLLFLFLYLPIVLAVYYIVPAKWRNVWLFIVNLVFYGWGEPVYIVLMLFSICINYLNGWLIGKHREDEKKAKRILLFNTIINLALLGFFKYYDLFATTLSQLSFLSFLHPLGISLPIGISFYTFQTMSYPIDVYRGDGKVQKNFISFGTYVALFPQLIAGPIVRYKDIDDQLDWREHSADKFASGIQRFVIGLAKKVLIANNVGALWDLTFATSLSELTFFGAWLGVFAYSIQIYFDFSGYSDMAIGLGRMFGFEFLENFNYPYISKSVTEFWRRWHISLGSWFRDYVYIPLGGNRKGRLRNLLNITVVWALTGFWHGAEWTFLLWGLYYAVFLILEKLFLAKPLQKLHVLPHIYTVLVVDIAWVLFNYSTLADCGLYYKAMFGGTTLFSQSDLYHFWSYLPILLVSILAATPLGTTAFRKIPEKAKRFAVPVLVLAALVVSTAYLVDATYNPFLYFRF